MAGMCKSMHGEHLIRAGETLTDINEQNPIAANGSGTTTDGVCLFSEDGQHLVRCVSPVERYEVPETCRFIDPSAFAYNTTLTSIHFPDGLEEIGDSAFVSSKLESVEIPASVKRIGNRAFGNCKALRAICLTEGLVHIGDNAFEGVRSLARLDIPASVSHIGKGLRRVFARRDNDGSRITIDPVNRHYFLDDRGVLYHRGEEGMVLLEALADIIGAYDIHEGTVDVQPDSFVCNTALVSVVVPEGVKSIGARAFQDCTHLETVVLPGSLELIGDSAFCRCLNLAHADWPEGLRSVGSHAFEHTSLERVRIPASLEHLGLLALILDGYLPNDPADGTKASCYGIPEGYSYDSPATTGYWMLENLQSPFDAPRKMAVMMVHRMSEDGQVPFTVAEGNDRFSIQNDFLCEKTDGGFTRAVLYVGCERVITVPRSVSRVCAQALSQALDVRELRLHTGIESFGADALKLSRALEVVRVDRGDEPALCVYPATGSMGVIAQNFGFAGGHLDLPSLVRACDSSLAHMENGFERLWRIVARLDNGQMLSDENRKTFEQAVEEGLEELVRGYARRDDTEGFDVLFRLNFIGPSNIVQVIETTHEMGNAATTHYLLERKRQLGLGRVLDLDL